MLNNININNINKYIKNKGDNMTNNDLKEDLRMLEDRVRAAREMAQICDIEFIYHERPLIELQKRHETRYYKPEEEHLKQKFGALLRDYGQAFTNYITHCQCKKK